MFNASELPEIIDIFDKHDQLKERLKAFLDPVALALDFDYTTKVDLDKDHITFVAVWYGQYQSEDRKAFSFPTSLLTEGTEAIIASLRGEKEKEEQAAKLEAKVSSEKAEKSLYETLKAKYEK